MYAILAAVFVVVILAFAIDRRTIKSLAFLLFMLLAAVALIAVIVLGIARR